MTFRRPAVPIRALALALVLVALAATGCARPTATMSAAPPEAAVRDFSFATDTFAFRNDIRARDPDKPDLYANYCFVMARALRQFHTFVRFDPAAPKLDHDGYAARVRQVVETRVWDPPLPPEARIVIPGYPNLRAFTTAEEPAVKTGLGGRLGTWLHPTNWRVMLPVTAGHQEDLARDMIEQVRRGQLVQLLVTNWPKPELNHTIIVFAYRRTPAGLEFVTWDPNDPSAPGVVTLGRRTGRFFATRVYDTEPGPIRAYFMYHNPWL